MLETLIDHSQNIDTTKLTEGEKAVLSIVGGALKELTKQMTDLSVKLDNVPTIRPEFTQQSFVEQYRQTQQRVELMWTVGKWLVTAVGIGTLALVGAAVKFLFPALGL